MRRVWLWTLPGLAVIGAAGLLVWGPSGGNAADPPYRLASLDRGAITASVRATGTVNPVTTVLVGSQLSGLVVEILADYNSPVRAGQVVARLNSEQILSRRDAAHAELEQAKADLGMRRAQAEKARALLLRAEAGAKDQEAQRDRARAQLSEATRGLGRQSELNQRAVGTQTALEQARTQVEVQSAAVASAEAQIASNQAEIISLKADIVLAEAQVRSAEALILQREARLKEVEIDLARVDIRSPVDGVVVKRDVELGQTVAASLSAPTLFTVAQDLREVEIYANIDEADVGRLKASQSVTFTVSAYPNRTFAGTVRLVRLGAQTVQNVVTYTAIIRVANADQMLLPGMTANLQIVTDERGDVLRVPNAALRFRPAVQGANTRIPDAVAGTALPQTTRARPLNEMRERLIAQVQPTPEQLVQIDRIIGEARPAAPAFAPEERRNGGRGLRQDLQQKISEVLDPERRAKLRDLVPDARRGARPPPADAGTPGRVYVLDGENRPQPVAVRTGVTDGSYTEVVAGEVQAGSAVIVGGGPRGAGPGSEPGGSSSAPRARGPRLF